VTGKSRHKLPFVLLNLAMSADGKIATANRAVSSFSSKRDQEHMLELRATADAVMSGARTVDLNPVTLGPGTERYRRQRLRAGLAEYNLRVIVSGSGSIDPDATIFKKRFSPIVILTTERISAKRLGVLQRLADDIKTFGKTELDFHAAFIWLRKKWRVKRLLCEGGGELDGALFQADLVDEIHLTLCPTLIGGRDAPTIADGKDPLKLADAKQFKLVSMKRHGDEAFLVYRRARSGRTTQPK
jgi:2,5-diamino-6-(ribosylamino)-4(3H)-pyrimidinone 5'-phosphate reductase